MNGYGCFFADFRFFPSYILTPPLPPLVGFWWFSRVPHPPPSFGSQPGEDPRVWVCAFFGDSAVPIELARFGTGRARWNPGSYPRLLAVGPAAACSVHQFNRFLIFSFFGDPLAPRWGFFFFAAGQALAVDGSFQTRAFRGSDPANPVFTWGLTALLFWRDLRTAFPPPRFCAGPLRASEGGGDDPARKGALEWSKPSLPRLPRLFGVKFRPASAVSDTGGCGGPETLDQGVYTFAV